MKPQSKCCQATMTVFTGSEGTNHWICARCGQPCDPMQNEPTMNTVTETALGYFMEHKGIYSQADVEKLVATARAEGSQEERERIKQLINNHKYGSPKSCDESYWYTRGDKLIKSQVYFEALTDVLEALTAKEHHAE